MTPAPVSQDCVLMRWEEEGITSTESDNGAKEILLAGAGEKTNDRGEAEECL